MDWGVLVMKVRHKQQGTVIDLGTSWEVVQEVPTSTWRDVTGECEHTEDGWQMKHANSSVQNWPELPTGYRLRKVQLWNGDGSDYDIKRVDAFIVEQREP
jgi:hypothetical protein